MFQTRTLFTLARCLLRTRVGIYGEQKEVDKIMCIRDKVLGQVIFFCEIVHSLMILPAGTHNNVSIGDKTGNALIIITAERFEILHNRPYAFASLYRNFVSF